jgi:hypothetical protein
MGIEPAPGLKQVSPPLVSRGKSLFSGQYRAQWGPIGAPEPPSSAPVVTVPTKEQASGGGLGPAVASMGRIKMPTPDVLPHEIVPGAPRLTNVQNRRPWWQPTLDWWRPAPGYGRKVRTFSDNPLPVQDMQAWSSNQVLQRPARIGGQRVTRWPPQELKWPTFGPGGT